MDSSTKIKDIREKLDMSQADFARSIGFAQSAVAQWESGKRNPSLKAMVKIFKLAKKKRIGIKQSNFLLG